MKVDWKWRVLF